MLKGKQREILEREKLFLEVARTLFLREGFHGVTIGRIARETGFSKGTIYQQFSCKEELVVELGILGYDQLAVALERAALFPGRPRERMVAVGEAVEHYWAEYSDHARVLSIIETETVLEKVPPEQQERLALCDSRLMDVMQGIVQDAVEEGDLVLPADATRESLCLALWTLADGLATARRRMSLLKRLGMENPLKDILRNAQRLMDAYGWRPLYDEWDYHETSRKIRSTFVVKLPNEAQKTRPEGGLSGSSGRERGGEGSEPPMERRVPPAK